MHKNEISLPLSLKSSWHLNIKRQITLKKACEKEYVTFNSLFKLIFFLLQSTNEKPKNKVSELFKDISRALHITNTDMITLWCLLLFFTFSFCLNPSTTRIPTNKLRRTKHHFFLWVNLHSIHQVIYICTDPLRVNDGLWRQIFRVSRDSLCKHYTCVFVFSSFFA